jgi:nucleoside-diphosphate-sugar epimerase
MDPQNSVQVVNTSQQAHYLVTGAGGFIGKALCRFLQERGASVRALLRRSGEYVGDESVICDLSEKNLPSSLMDGIDGVFHLAGIAHVPDIAAVPDTLYRRINLDATRSLLELAAQSRVERFVYFSSVKAAAHPGEHCVDETWDEPPADAYGRSKRDAEQRVIATGKEKGMHVCNLRPCLVYGPGVKGNLSRMIHAIEKGAFPPFPELGNKRSMVGMDDLIDAAWLAMNDTRACGKTYIISDGLPYSTRDLYIAISNALEKRVPRWTVPILLLHASAAVGDLLVRVSHRPMPMSSSVLQRLRGWACYRSDRIHRELGWAPRQTFEDILPDIVSTCFGQAR